MLFRSSRQGLTEVALESLFDEVTGLRMKRLLERYVRGTGDLPLARLLAPFGVTLVDGRQQSKVGLGVRTTKEGNDCKLASVHEGGAAHLAGLSAGDVMAAMNGLRVSGTNLDGLLARYRVGDSVTVHAFRRDELMSFEVTLVADDAPQISLTTQSKPLSVRRMRAAWLQKAR